MKKNILIMYGSYGSGHKSMASYIKSYFDDNSKDNIFIYDIVDSTNFLGDVGIKVYDAVIKYRAGFLFDISYEIMNHKLTNLKYRDFVIKSFDNETTRNNIIKCNPDIVISTHFFTTTLITYYNSIGLTHAKVMTIITDYKCHEWWIDHHKEIDSFIVGNEIVRNELIANGVDKNKVQAFGLPLKFDRELDTRENVLKKYNLSGNKPIFLFFGGGSVGSMGYYKYFKGLVKNNYDIDIIFVCGKNEALKDKCDEYINKYNIKNTTVIGYTTDVFNLMNISDAIISKSGGATVTECIEMKRPMIILPGYGGQEKYNQIFMCGKGCAVYASTINELNSVIEDIIKDKSIIDNMKLSLDLFDKNNSIKDIYDLTYRLLK